jgi:hypothetical protein
MGDYDDVDDDALKLKKESNSKKAGGAESEKSGGGGGIAVVALLLVFAVVGWLYREDISKRFGGEVAKANNGKVAYAKVQLNGRD